MAISWLAVLQSVPWTDVISNAPKVAEGAKKLWNTVSRKSAPPEPAATEVETVMSPESRAIDGLETRVALLEAAVSDLHAQMLASSELIQALAEQNAQLIRRVELGRQRLVWFAAATAIFAVATATGLAIALVRLGA